MRPFFSLSRNVMRDLGAKNACKMTDFAIRYKWCSRKTKQEVKR